MSVLVNKFGVVLLVKKKLITRAFAYVKALHKHVDEIYPQEERKYEVFDNEKNMLEKYFLFV